MNRRTFTEWLEDARDDWREYAEVAFALGMIAFAAFLGTAGALWVFAP